MDDFSLIILCRGRRHLLPQTLDTLRTQVGSFEVLLLDGEGSGRLSELAQRYSDLKIKVQDASGRSLPVMMNEGVQSSAGKYVQFLEPGDRYISQHGLSYLKEIIAEKPSLISANGVAQNTQSHWFLREKLLELGGFDERLAYRPMMDFLFRFTGKGNQGMVCKRVLVDGGHELNSILETCKILYRHFGFWHALKWIFKQDHSDWMRKTSALLKQAFWRD